MALSGLPPDILLRILEVLEHKDRLRLALVCRGFRNLVRTDFRSIRVICMHMSTRQSSEQAKWLQEVALKDTKVRHLQVHRKQTERLEGKARERQKSCQGKGRFCESISIPDSTKWSHRFQSLQVIGFTSGRWFLDSVKQMQRRIAAVVHLSLNSNKVLGFGQMSLFPQFWAFLTLKFLIWERTAQAGLCLLRM